MSDLRELYQEVILDHNKRPRNFRTRRAFQPKTSSPFQRTRPLCSAGGVGTSRITESIVTLFPDPDSPTTPTLSPARTTRSTPSTDRMKACLLRE